MTIFGLSNKQFKPVLEKYVGNNRKEFKIIESELKKIIDYIKEKDEYELRSIEIKNLPSNKLVERMVKDIFQLKDITIYWENTPIPNAISAVKTLIVFDKVKDNGYEGKTNQSYDARIVLTTGLVTTANLNEKELTAVLLHEIGHGFYNSIFHFLATVSLGTTPIPLIEIPVSIMYDLLNIPKLYSELRSTISDIIDNIPILRKIIYAGSELLFTLSGIIRRSPYYLPSLIMIIPFSLMSLMNYARYNSEKHADSFAVDYGYGIYLASGLTKLRKSETKVLNELRQEYTTIDKLVDVFELQVLILEPLVTGYPSDQNRIRSILDRLKRSLNDKELPVELRKDIEKQIKELEEFYYGRYLKMNDGEKRKLSLIYMGMVDKIFNGKLDIRELVYALDPKKYK